MSRKTTPPLLGLTALIFSFLVTSAGVSLNYVLIEHLSQTIAAPRGAPADDRPDLIRLAYHPERQHRLGP